MLTRQLPRRLFRTRAVLPGATVPRAPVAGGGTPPSASGGTFAGHSGRGSDFRGHFSRPLEASGNGAMFSEELCWWTRESAMGAPHTVAKDGAGMGYHPGSSVRGGAPKSAAPSAVVTGMFRYSFEEADVATSDVNWALAAMGVTASEARGGARRNVSVEETRKSARHAEFSVCKTSKALGTAADGSVSKRAVIHAVPVEPLAEGAEETAPEAPEAWDYKKNAIPETGYNHPTAWLPSNPGPNLAGAVKTIPAARFDRLVDRAIESISRDSPDGTLLRDVSVGGTDFNVRIVTDSLAVDRYLGNVFASPEKDGVAVAKRRELSASSIFGGVNPDSDDVEGAHFKAIRDWPFHVEVICASRMNVPRPQRYQLDPAANRFAVIDFARRKIVLGGDATGEDVADAIIALYTHFATRGKDAAVVTGRTTVSGKVAVFGLAADVASDPAVAAAVAGESPISVTSGFMAPAFASAPRKVASASGAAAFANRDSLVLIDAATGESIVSSPRSESSEDGRGFSAIAIAGTAGSASDPVLTKISAGDAGEAAAGAAVSAAAVSQDASIVAEKIAEAVEATGTAFLVNAAAPKADIAAALNALAKGESTEKWEKKAAPAAATPATPAAKPAAKAPPKKAAAPKKKAAKK